MIFRATVFLVVLSVASLHAQRTTVLPQIDLPMNYYYREIYLPQLTSGPSSVSWSPDGAWLVYSMAGSLWKQKVGSDNTEQLTDGSGYDYQPDWSPDRNSIVFVRYDGASVELMLLDLNKGTTAALTSNKAVNLEPRWSPDGTRIAYVSTHGTGHFLLFTAKIATGKLTEITCITPDRKSLIRRYYYSPFDHAINPAWSRDGQEIYCVSNREIGHGTGDMVRIKAVENGSQTLVHHEETTWRARPDISPDGSRMVYSSYLGRNFHQLWMLPAQGGYPFPVTYGEFDNTSPRWSPDGNQIAFISNRDGNTSLWLLNAFDGKQTQVKIKERKYLNPRHTLQLTVRDEKGNEIPARASITDNREKFYSPSDAVVHADDAFDPKNHQFEAHYFHLLKSSFIDVPKSKINITVSHGPEFEIIHRVVEIKSSGEGVDITLKHLQMPPDFKNWRSGDLHVHMNYGGHYMNTPAVLMDQAKAENLSVICNLIVNKEQRIPDIKYFSTAPDKISSIDFLLLHGQEFHSSFWGHVGILKLKDHYILPDYSGYPYTAAASLYPHNTFIIDRAHEQGALVGYVHPFEHYEIFPDQSSKITHVLPVDAALGKNDYFEVMGISDHHATAFVWYKLLNCGIRLPAGAGTDAMANYASLRGPVGLNRVYVQAEGELREDSFLDGLKEGRTLVTNGPMIGFTVENAGPGGELNLKPGKQTLSYTGFLSTSIPVDHLEVIWNGNVVVTHPVTKNFMEVRGKLTFEGPGWLLLRAWGSKAHPDLMDIYPYASTSPVYVSMEGKEIRSKSAAEYFLKWVERLRVAAESHKEYRSEEERKAVLADFNKAKEFYLKCLREATTP